MGLEFTPEVYQLVQAGFGVLFLGAVIILLNLARTALKPFQTMTEFIQDSQQNLAASQREMVEVIKANTATLVGVSESVEKLVLKVLGTNSDLVATIGDINDAQLRLEEEQQVGVLIKDESMSVVLYSESALDVLGWGVHDLPSDRSPSTPPVLTASSDPITAARWPAAIALREDRAIENVPLQVFSQRERTFKWVIVSAYPCHECLEEGERWVTVIIRKLESLGRT